MGRIRRLHGVVALAALAAAGCCLCGADNARAQTADAPTVPLQTRPLQTTEAVQDMRQGGAVKTDPRLFVPMIDGDGQNVPRFRKPAFGTAPGSGAGRTGFDSSNTRTGRKKPPPVRSEPLPPLAPADQTVTPIYREPPPRRPSRATAIAPDIPSTYQRRPAVRRDAREEDPFGPVGLRVGAFTVRPAVEIGGGYDNNPGRLPERKGSTVWKVAPELQIQSEWTRHQFLLDWRGSYTWYPRQDAYDKPSAALKAQSRIDINSETTANLEARFNLDADSPGNPNVPSDVASPPTYTTLGGTAGLTRRFNRLEVTAKASGDRRRYDDARLNDGTALSLDDRNYDQYGGSLRAAFEISPGIKPFVEAGIDRRKHETIAQERDSDGLTLRAGAQFELTRRLTGEISAGTLRREYKDASFGELRGTLLDGSLTFHASPLTAWKLEMLTTVDESVLPGVSGALKRDVNLQVDHSFRRWLIGTLKFGYGVDDYEGLDREDERYFASAGLTYKLSRAVWLKGEFRQDWLRSNVTGVDYTASALLFGLRLQR